MMMLMMLLTIIASITMLASMLMSKKTFMEREKMSPYECGFDPKSSARLPFSLQFFIVATIFLIFDVEITMLLPFIMLMKTASLMVMFNLTTIFILILIFGLYHEWNQGSLNWTI
uniref:NADH-ubiquinone oxidoreductase chain 3 n=1 Tax=Dictyoptera aurora TaxID=1053893 RepID=A0A0S2MNB7_9COLE|nr:NADH deshydrogenase subunit 3 [Dictyoptera aurora]